MMNKTPEMTEARLRALIDAYGAAPERWPAAERDVAVALLARAPEIQKYARSAATLDGLLDSATLAEPSTALRDAVHDLQAAPAEPAAPAAPPPSSQARKPFRWAVPDFILPFVPQFRPAALALATVLGLVYGYAGLSGGQSPAPGWETVDASLIAGGSQLVGVGYLMEENR